MSRLLLVANRLPITVKLTADHVRVGPSDGGLATGLRGPHRESEGLWFGWPGDVSKLNPAQRLELEAHLQELRAVPIVLSTQEVARYYEGLANSALWPICHYLIDRARFRREDWEAYVQVNRRFAEKVAEHYRQGDRIWVHDYHLGLLPAMLRERLPEARIGFFLHIPFPSSEVFQIFPWREQLLEGLLGADLIGFHTLAYARNFARSLLRVLGTECDVDRIHWRGRTIVFGAFPMGVDAGRFAQLAQDPKVMAEAKAIREAAGGRQILLGIDRLDYTKGLVRRLQGIQLLLEQEPEVRGRLRMIQIVVPSRTRIEAYTMLRREVEELVGRINGQFGSPGAMPIHYVYRSLSERQVIALYRAADVMLVTPLRDGMNLVAKEFVASRVDEGGVLVLSEFAGAATDLGEALLVNPYAAHSLAASIHKALTMSQEDRKARMGIMRARVMHNDVHRWGRNFLEALERSTEALAAAGPTTRAPTPDQAVLYKLRQAPGLVLLLDYDGTLVPFASRPELVRPDEDLLDLLRSLAARPSTWVHIVSGRTRENLDQWLGSLPVGLHAQHGLWSRLHPDAPWTSLRDVPTSWIPKVRSILEQYAAMTHGSWVEDKDTGLAWHFRMADPEVGNRQARELRLHLAEATSQLPVEVLPGDHVIEVRAGGIHKGMVVPAAIAAAGGSATVVALGDDQTDEDLFAALPEDGIAIHVGPEKSRARYRLPDSSAARAFLRSLL